MNHTATINVFKLFPKIGMKNTSKLTGSLGDNINMVGSF